MIRGKKRGTHQKVPTLRNVPSTPKSAKALAYLSIGRTRTYSSTSSHALEPAYAQTPTFHRSTRNTHNQDVNITGYSHSMASRRSLSPCQSTPRLTLPDGAGMGRHNLKRQVIRHGDSQTSHTTQLYSTLSHNTQHKPQKTRENTLPSSAPHHHRSFSTSATTETIPSAERREPKRHIPLGSVRISPDYCFYYPGNTPPRLSATYKINSIEEMQLFARAMAQGMPPTQTNVLLYGDIGTGKTTFTKYFLRYLTRAPTLTVTSPTFTLQMIYRHNNIEYRHYDLYRLKSAEETRILGLKESYQPLAPVKDHHTATMQGAGQSIPPAPANTADIHALGRDTKLNNTAITPPGTVINLIEWPHILHYTEFMPDNYIRLDLNDHMTYKTITLSFVGDHYPIPNTISTSKLQIENGNIFSYMTPGQLQSSQSPVLILLHSLENSGVARVSPTSQILYQHKGYEPLHPASYPSIAQMMANEEPHQAIPPPRPGQQKQPDRENKHEAIDDIHNQDDDDDDYEDDYQFNPQQS